MFPCEGFQEQLGVANVLAVVLKPLLLQILHLRLNLFRLILQTVANPNPQLYLERVLLQRYHLGELLVQIGRLLRFIDLLLNHREELGELALHILRTAVNLLVE